MEILYVIGEGSKRDNLELRMSLRSICKYASNVSKVVVVGSPPSWLSDEVVKLEVKDIYDCKHKNILFCIEAAIARDLVRGDFLYSSDDHFYVKPVDFNHYPYFIKRELRRTCHRSDYYYRYHRSLYETRNLLLRHSLPTMDYSQHCNTHMNADIFKSMLPLVHESYDIPYGAEPTSLIMNVWQTRPNPPPLQKRFDLKIRQAKTIREIYDQIGDRDSFSISDSVYENQAIFDFFQKEYPEKCRFERD